MDINAMIAELSAKQAAVGSIPAPAAYVPAPAPVAPLSRPSYWVPGDPMNAVQTQLQSLGMPLSVIASRADNPPPAELGATYDKAVQAPVERGFVNPPEAPPIAAINPAAMAAMIPAPAPVSAPAAVLPMSAAGFTPKPDRDALKAEAMRRGLVGSNCRLGAESLEKLLASGTVHETPPAPAPAPAPFGRPDPASYGPASASAPAPAQLDLSVATYPARLEAAIEAQGGPYTGPGSLPPAPSSIPVPVTAVMPDDAVLDAIAERLFARICKALTFA
jgi:hypothetical protein